MEHPIDSAQEIIGLVRLAAQTMVNAGGMPKKVILGVMYEPYFGAGIDGVFAVTGRIPVEFTTASMWTIQIEGES